MTRRCTPLDAEAVAYLPDRCRRCLFWELGAARPAEDEDEDRSAVDTARMRKQAWITSQSLEQGTPGVVLREEGNPVGFALFAPSRSFAPRAGSVPSVSQDALLLATAWLAPAARSAGLGRLLVQAALRDAIERDLPVVEVLGDRRAREWDCVLPVTWLLHEGFEVAREHPRYPLLRLETRRTVRWASSLEQAASDLLGRVPLPSGRPSPAAPARVHLEEV